MIDLTVAVDSMKRRFKVVYICGTEGALYQVVLNAESAEDAKFQWENLQAIKYVIESFRFVEAIEIGEATDE